LQKTPKKHWPIIKDGRDELLPQIINFSFFFKTQMPYKLNLKQIFSPHSSGIHTPKLIRRAQNSAAFSLVLALLQSVSPKVRQASRDGQAHA